MSKVTIKQFKVYSSTIYFTMLWRWTSGMPQLTSDLCSWRCRFTMRDFQYNEEELKADKDELTRLSTDKKKQFVRQRGAHYLAGWAIPGLYIPTGIESQSMTQKRLCFSIVLIKNCVHCFFDSTVWSLFHSHSLLKFCSFLESSLKCTIWIRISCIALAWNVLCAIVA